MIRLARILSISYPLMLLLQGCAAAPPQTYDIAFVSQEGGGPRHFHFMSDTGNLSAPLFLPDGMDLLYGSSISWSPDGLKLAFAARMDGNTDIYTIHANGTGLARITTDPIGEWNPEWSPDGSKILYQTGQNIISVHELSSGMADHVTVGPHVGSAAWSPDSTKIAYIRSLGYMDEWLFIIDRSAGTTTQVASLPGEGNALLRWAPSSDTLLFTNPGAPDKIYKIRADGTGLTNVQPVIPGYGYRSMAAWYSGNRVLYVRDDYNTVGLSVMSQGGSGEAWLKELDHWPSSPRYRFASTALPDLVVASHYSSFNPAGSEYLVSVTIQNVGTAESGKSRVYIDLTTDKNEIKFQESIELPELAVGEESEKFDVVFENFLKCQYEVRKEKITVDPKNEVYESFENNNMLTLFFACPLYGVTNPYLD